MILYAVAAEQSLGRLFLAGIGPGLLLVGLFAGYVALLFPLTPGIEDVKQARVARPTVVLSSDGRELASFFASPTGADDGTREGASVAVAGGRIAVKVINHFGDEVMKVFGV